MLTPGILKRNYSLLRKILDRPNEEKKATVYDIRKIGEITQTSVSIPKLKNNDVLIRVDSVALSGSDLHVWECGRTICPEVSLGLDATGIVCDVGDKETDLCVGDRVVMEPGLSCGVCQMCKNGQYCMCPRMVYSSFLRDFQVHPSDLCHKLPCEVSLREATLTSTLAIGCQACRKAGINPASNVLVIGSNTNAIAVGLCARVMGAQKIIFASTIAKELSWLKRKFCFDGITIDRNFRCNDFLERIFNKFGTWPDVAINCAISEETMNLSIMVLQPCGVCILAQSESEFASFNSLGVLMKNISIIPCFRSTSMFPAAIHLLKSGKAPIKLVLARTFSWENIKRAFDEAMEISYMGCWRVALSTETRNTDGCGDGCEKPQTKCCSDSHATCV